MVTARFVLALALFAVAFIGTPTSAQETGTLRGIVYDREFEAPLEGARITIVETEASALSNEQGNFVIPNIKAGNYTVIVSMDDFDRQVKKVPIIADKFYELEVWLQPRFVDMEELVVEDNLQLDASSEAGLLQIRFESPALLDSISADLMRRAGASDAASALSLVSGASVKDGKSAVIRGLPDRYVSSQLNGVRLPSADEEKRAVELDQFPSAVIESIQVSKTFTPDQQGDASGGAVDVVLKGIPEDPFFIKFSSQMSFNTQSALRSDFFTYDEGNLTFWGNDADNREVQVDNLGMNWTGDVGVSNGSAPVDYKWSISTGGNHEFDNGLRIGGLVNFYYERDSSFFNDGIDDSFWVTTPGQALEPRAFQGTVNDGDYKTNLLDVTQASRQLQWSMLGAIGAEWEEQKIDIVYFRSTSVENNANISEDTRGKAWFFPGYDPDDPTTPGHSAGDRDAAPYLRLETLQYLERRTDSLQFKGQHKIPVEYDFILAPEVDWSVALSTSERLEPDKRQFGSLWLPAFNDPGFPPFLPPQMIPATHFPFKPGANFTLGNLQRTFKEINEESFQYQINLKLPFEQWTGDEGYLKFGIFSDSVERTYRQEGYSNFNDNSSYAGDFNDFWSAAFPLENHPVSGNPFDPTSEDFIDVDYDGEIDVNAWYFMVDLPLTSEIKLIAGARFESTKIGIVNFPESDAFWFPPGAVGLVELNPGDGDVDYDEDNFLPSISLEYKPHEDVVIRGAWSRTIARQTFRELTPILQQEFLGGPVFIGNPDLTLSRVQNWDVRVDWTPYEGGFVSLSWFKKYIKDAIEYVQVPLAFDDVTQPRNYPEGELSGFEIEVRQDLGYWFDDLDGFTFGANATLISAEVVLPDDEAARFASPLLQVPMETRDMTNAPEYLYNIYLNYDNDDWGLQASVFWSVTGDTLIVGAGESTQNFVPSIYELANGTLNFSVTKRVGEYFNLRFQAKNLTNPEIKRVYRSDYTGSDRIQTAFRRGMEFSLTFSGEFTF